MANGHGGEVEAKGRTCSICKTELPLSSFPTFIRNGRNGRTYYGSQCLPCKREYQRGRRGRDWRLKKTYGISVSDWESLFEKQGRECAACGSGDPGGKYWHTDHDHGCCPGKKSCGKCIRAILCHPCNTALGLAQDSVEHLQKLITYLEVANGERTRWISTP